MIILIILVGTVLRIAKIFFIDCIAKDSIRYIDAARLFWEHCQIHPVWPPLYPFFIGLVHRVIPSVELSGVLVSTLCGVGLLFLVFYAIKHLFDLKCALFCTAITAVHPMLVRYSAEVLSEMLFVLLFCVFLFSGYKMLKKPHIRLSIVLGVTSGLLYLTKPEGFIVVPIISVWILFLAVSWPKKIAYTIAMWAVCLFVMIPYLYALKVTAGSWMLSQKTNIVFSSELLRMGFIETFVSISPFEYAQQHPVLFLKKIIYSCGILFNKIPDALTPVFFLFWFIGIVRGWKHMWVRYILSFFLIFCIGYIIFHPGKRYLVIWIVPMLPIVYMGIELLEKRKKFYYVCISLIIVPMIFLCIQRERVGSARWKQAGLWIKDNISPNNKIFSEDPRVGFYAQRDLASEREKETYVVSFEREYTDSVIQKFDSGVTIYYVE